MEVFGSLMNRLMEGSGQPEVFVGMGATILAYSDRYAGTVISINKDKSISVQEDNSERVDDNGMSDCQEYSYWPRPNGQVWTFSKRKDGRWREKGVKQSNSNGLRLGVRDKHYDFSF